MAEWPRIGVGALVRRDDAVLLVLRGRPPCEGEWAVPGGKLHAGETLAQALERELLEECAVRVRCGKQAFHFEHIDHDEAGALRFHYVVLDFHAEWLEGEPRAGDDALEARWVRFDELDSLPVNAVTREALAQVYDLSRGT